MRCIDFYKVLSTQAQQSEVNLYFAFHFSLFVFRFSFFDFHLSFLAFRFSFLAFRFSFFTFVLIENPILIIAQSENLLF